MEKIKNEETYHLWLSLALEKSIDPRVGLITI